MTTEGKTAIVTGGSSGIGRSIAAELAREGADVVVGDVRRRPKLAEERRSTVELVREAGREALFVETDVANGPDSERLVRRAVEEFGRVDVLVNNAGTSSGGSVEDVSPDGWDRVFEVNVKGVYNVSKHAIPEIRKRDAGRIINVASQLGLVGQGAYAAYCASKGAVVNLTRQMAIDFGEHRITVNAICPGIIRTSRTIDRLKDDAYADFYDRYNLVPFIGEPRDVGRAAAYLASDDARYVTGQCLVIDGGYTAH